jgi:ADP-ribose pyrophosphatase YjhB (NUDIX family)
MMDEVKCLVYFIWLGVDMRVIEGERIAKTALLKVGCSGIVFDESRQKILLTRRSDNGRWCIPGGAVDAGETAAEACERELLEETGLRVRVTRLVGIYTSPHRILEYADGNRWHLIALSFEAHALGGELQISDETTEVGYFTLDEIAQMDVMDHHRERIADALTNQAAAFVK